MTDDGEHDREPHAAPTDVGGRCRCTRTRVARVGRWLRTTLVAGRQVRVRSAESANSIVRVAPRSGPWSSRNVIRVHCCLTSPPAVPHVPCATSSVVAVYTLVIGLSVWRWVRGSVVGHSSATPASGHDAEGDGDRGQEASSATRHRCVGERVIVAVTVTHAAQSSRPSAQSDGCSLRSPCSPERVVLAVLRGQARLLSVQSWHRPRMSIVCDDGSNCRCFARLMTALVELVFDRWGSCTSVIAPHELHTRW